MHVSLHVEKLTGTEDFLCFALGTLIMARSALFFFSVLVWSHLNSQSHFDKNLECMQDFCPGFSFASCFTFGH